ncbi:MAG: inosine-uridine nucleoside N-ribohydrolase [Arcticibacterium sp.]|jgi:inosine-uridine nucleoside N-ribohydrolase
MKGALLILLVFLFQNFGFAQKKNVWIDTDIMMGNPNGVAANEIDDGIALLMAIENQDKLDIKGISLITYVDYGYVISDKLLKWYAADENHTLYKGADTCGNLEFENEATRAMAKALEKETLSILALGPATNVAILLNNYPELASNIDEIIFCAGRSPNVKFVAGLGKTTMPDYNFEMDVAAFKVVLESGVKVVLAGFESSKSLFLGETDYAFLKKGNEKNKWLYQTLRPWSKRNIGFYGSDGFIPYDCTPLGYLTHPQYFKTKSNQPVRIIEKPNDQNGGLTNKMYLEVSEEFDSPYRCRFVYETVLGFEEEIVASIKRVTKDEN